MPRFLLFVVVALATSVRPGVASDDSQMATRACQLLAEGVSVGEGYAAQSAGQCNASEQCLSTKRFIEQHHKVVPPELTCASAPKSSPPPAKFFDIIFDDACALAATQILTGVGVGDLQDEIALCNQHPDKRSCLRTKTFIAGSRGGNSGGVSCQ